MKIVLVEDREEHTAQLKPALDRAIDGRGEVVLFSAFADRGECTHDEQLVADLTDRDLLDATLIVADRDLSGLGRYNGLSEPTVRRVADQLAIPECGYARGEKPHQEVLEGAVRENRISVSLEHGPEAFARQVVAVERGFEFIRAELPRALAAPGRKSPGRVLAALLGKPEYAEKIALYASGDQNRLVNVLRVRGSPAEQDKRLTCLLGYWLWDSILRYPGVVVNMVAASSYLNIHEGDFAAADVMSVFDDARYAGPFSGALAPTWWRGMLDDMVAASGAKDGREFAGRQVRRELRRSECCEDPAVPAIYYCMFSTRPVSLEHSKPGLAWFPRGADLARISNSKYDEIVPWL